jgi:hypothetical protein
MKRTTNITRYILLIVLLTGCGVQSTAVNPTATMNSAQTQPPTSSPAIPSETPAPTLLPTMTATPAPVVLEADVNASTLNVRAGPSILHDVLTQFVSGDAISAIGVAPGLQWIKVINKDNKTGWVLIDHITLKGDVSALPILPISESLVAKGKVVDANGKGIPGIQVALSRMGGAQAVRVDGISMANGNYYIYAPVSFQGTWLATIIGVGCKSPIVDTNCRYAGKFSPAQGIPVKLPQDVELTFTYQ